MSRVTMERENILRRHPAILVAPVAIRGASTPYSCSSINLRRKSRIFVKPSVCPILHVTSRRTTGASARGRASCLRLHFFGSRSANHVAAERSSHSHSPCGRNEFVHCRRAYCSQGYATPNRPKKIEHLLRVLNVGLIVFPCREERSTRRKIVRCLSFP